MGSTMTRSREPGQNSHAINASVAGESIASGSSTLSTLKSEDITAPSWYDNSNSENTVEAIVKIDTASEQGDDPPEVTDSPHESGKTSKPLSTEEQNLLDDTVHPYLENDIYYESLKSVRPAKARSSPKIDAAEEPETSSAEETAPGIEAVANSQSPIPTSAPNSSRPAEDPQIGKYPYRDFTPIENFEAYLAGAPELNLEELYHRAAVVQKVLQDYQKEWLEVDKQVYEWEDADKSRAKIQADEQKAQGDLEQAEDDARMLELMSEYKSYLSFSRRDWNESFTKQYEEQYEEMDEVAEAKARATLVLLNRLRDPFYMKGFHRRQKALQSQKWDSKLVEKPLPESKQTKEERDLDERKRKFLTDRITFDDMSRADAYGYTYNALDLSRGDQKLPNLRVAPKSKPNKRGGKEADLDVDVEAPRPKRARKGVVTESGDNSEAASATEEDAPLPEKRRGRGQNLKLAEVNAGLTASNEPVKKATGKNLADEGNTRRQVSNNKPPGRGAAANGLAANGKGRAAAKSKLDQMLRAVSESEDDFPDLKRKAIDGDSFEEPAHKRAKVPVDQTLQPYGPAPMVAQTMHSIASILNDPMMFEPPAPPHVKQRRRPAPPTNQLHAGTNLALGLFPSNPETAENSEEDGLGRGKNKKSRLKTDMERKVQSDAMKENWKNPTGKMRMGIERRNRRAARKKFEAARIQGGGAENPNVIYKSDDENFSYEYFRETPPAPTPPAAAGAPAMSTPPSPFTIVDASPAPTNMPTELTSIPTFLSTLHPSLMYENTAAPTPSQSSTFGNGNDPVKKPRAKRPRPVKTTSSGSGRSRATSSAKNQATIGDHNDSDSSAANNGPSLYEQYQMIASPTSAVDLGKRKSIPRQSLPTYGTTSGEDEGDGSDFH